MNPTPNNQEPDFDYWRITTKSHQAPTLLELRHYIIKTLISDYGLYVAIEELSPNEKPEEYPVYNTFLCGSQVGWIYSDNESITVDCGLPQEGFQDLAKLLETVFDYKIICVCLKNQITASLFEEVAS